MPVNSSLATRPEEITEMPSSGLDLSPLQLKILVVEDNPLSREILQGLLAQLNVRADYAVDGIDAVTKVKASSSPYHLIFMDVAMPNLDGIAAAKSIRLLGAGRLANIVAVTADPSQQNKSACYNAGMNGFIAKPITLALLIESIQASPPAIASCLTQLNDPVE